MGLKLVNNVYIYVTKFFPDPKNWRGAYCLDFVKALTRHFEIEDCKSNVAHRKVLVFVEGSGVDYEVEGVTVHTFKTRYLPSNIFPFLFAKFNKRSFLNKVEAVLCSTFNLQPSTCFNVVEICHAHTANFGVYALALKHVNPKCKTLLHHHDLQSFGLNNGALRHCWLYNMIQFPILRRMHEKIDTHVFISEAVRRSFLAAPDTSWTEYGEYKKQMRWLPYRPVRIRESMILHNGVDVGIFSRVERVEHVDFVIGCVGNFQVLKGQITLLKAVQILSARSKCSTWPKIKVVFIGSGETLGACRRFAEENGLDVEFKTEVKHEELAEFYRGLDLFVLPSTFEGFGCVYTEAHSCGVPFIACEGQGVEDILVVENSCSGRAEGGSSNPWLCKQRDPEDLAKKIETAIHSIVHLGSSPSPTTVLQPLSEDQDIDKLVGKFVKDIGI